MSSYKWFVKRFKEFLATPKNKRHEKKHEILIFHGFEFWIILALLSLIFPILVYVLIGVMFHIFLDWIALLHYEIPLYCKTSQTYTFIRNKDKEDL